MYDMKPLEEKWLKYQTKKRKPLYLFFIVSIIILFSILFLLNKNDIKFNVFENFFATGNNVSNNLTPLSNKHASSFLLLNSALTRLEILESHTSDPLKFGKNSVSNNTTTTDMLVDIPILDENSENIASKDDNVRSKGKVHLDIIETTSISAYEDVEKRFHQSRNIDDALFLAKSYYKKGNYKKAEQWAFETNQLDSTLEESFLIFVKSKMKLGQKNEVISILNQYLKHNNSKDARVLLEKIKNEQF